MPKTVIELRAQLVQGRMPFWLLLFECRSSFRFFVEFLPSFWFDESLLI